MTMAYNQDFSLIVVLRNTLGPNKFELFAFNSTNGFWESRYREPADFSNIIFSNLIAIS